MLVMLPSTMMFRTYDNGPVVILIVASPGVPSLVKQIASVPSGVATSEVVVVSAELVQLPSASQSIPPEADPDRVAVIYPAVVTTTLNASWVATLTEKMLPAEIVGTCDVAQSAPPPATRSVPPVPLVQTAVADDVVAEATPDFVASEPTMVRVPSDVDEAAPS